MDLVEGIMPIQFEVGPVGLAYSLLFHKCNHPTGPWPTDPLLPTGLWATILGYRPTGLYWSLAY